MRTIIINVPRELYSLESGFQGGPASDRLLHNVYRHLVCYFSYEPSMAEEQEPLR